MRDWGAARDRRQQSRKSSHQIEQLIRVLGKGRAFMGSLAIEIV